jgi:hypothetical protein
VGSFFSKGNSSTEYEVFESKQRFNSTDSQGGAVLANSCPADSNLNKGAGLRAKLIFAPSDG